MKGLTKTERREMAEIERQHWLAMRKTGIGGSDISAIVGVNKYKTIVDLYFEKTSDVEDKAGEAAYWGNKLEDVVAREWADRNDREIQRVTSMLRHPEHPYMLANIDRAVVCPEVAGRVRVLPDGATLTTSEILEVKTSSPYVKDWGDDDDAVPKAYICQTQWYMGITGAEVCYMAVLIGGQQYRQYKIIRDDDLIGFLQERATDFWVNHVQSGVPPEAQTAEDIAKLWPNDDGDSVEADPETAIALGELTNLKAEAKQLAERIKNNEDMLKMRIGQHATLTLNGTAVASYKTQSANRLDSKALRAALPDVADRFTNTSDTRVLRLK